ncbi:DUF4347 domain-containing protein [Desulfobacter curvatus]|uniref:DUF4347 domain-containing protein n=1 Tax=Desulfobacter curvatus TaxID=2290 RepID=UPI000380CD49|nr:cadherin-like domain-containing protein [Desulfobacter curvatus]
MFGNLKKRFTGGRGRAKKHQDILHFEELEQRVLFSAEAVPGLDSPVPVVEKQVWAEDVTAEVKDERVAEPEAAELTAAESRMELVVVNDNVTDYEQLIVDLLGDETDRIIEVRVIETDLDGIGQISDILAEYSDLAAVHFIGYGADGKIQLGSTWLDGTTLHQNSDAVSGWGDALTDTGDLLFYGCNLIAGSEGQSLLNAISTLTGADIAASGDLTGHASLGGDWDLETTVGDVETDVVVSDVAQNYNTLMDGTIHHLGFSWNKTNGAWAIYADGVLTDSGTGLATGQTIRGGVGTGELLFGQEQDTLLGGFETWQGFTGTLYDVRIWNDVRSAAEIESYYQQKIDSDSLPSGLIANWQMDGFNGLNEVVDIVSGNNLSIGHASGDGFVTSTPVGDLNIDENSANGTSVGFVVPIGSTPLSGVEFTLTDPADSPFAIDISTGEITVANGSMLDYETATSHNITIQVTDSSSNSHSESMTIVVNDVDDDAPTVVNQSMTVAEGATNRALTLSDLQSADADTADISLIYTVSNVSNGILTINGSAWASSTNDSFTQQDIIDGNVVYTHDGTNTTSDSFAYSVADPTGNSLTGQTFSVTVTAANDAPTAANNMVTTNEDTVYTFSGSDFNFSDINGDSLATVKITTLETVAALQLSGTEVTLDQVISKADIDAGKLKFVPVADANGAGYDSFGFSVNDGTDDSTASYTMTIDVTAVNDAPAIAANTGATVIESSTGNVITTAMLNEGDPDDSGAGLTYTVTSIVTNGTLSLNGTALVNNDAFTQADIDAGLVTYDHDGNTTSDSFAFSLADGGEDGTAAATGNFSITITAVDDDTPIQVNNPGSGTLIEDPETDNRNNLLEEGPDGSVPMEDFQGEDDLTSVPDYYLTFGDASTEESPSVLTQEADNGNQPKFFF